jgi:hypothetical protein
MLGPMVVAAGCGHWNHRHHSECCVSSPPSEKFEFSLVTHSYACSTSRTCTTKTQIDQIVRLETTALHRTGSFNFQNQSSQKQFSKFSGNLASSGDKTWHSRVKLDEAGTKCKGAKFRVTCSREDGKT